MTTSESFLLDLLKLLSEQQARDILNIGHTKYWSLIKDGELDAVCNGPRTKVTLESVKRYIKRGRDKAKQKFPAQSVDSTAA